MAGSPKRRRRVGGGDFRRDGGSVRPLLMFDGLVVVALAGDSGSRGALLALFNEVRSDSQAIAALAVELIQALKGDPTATIDAAYIISDVAREVLTSQGEFDTDAILAAFEIIDAVIVVALADAIDTAAGDEREDLLNLEEPLAGDESSVSAS